MDSWSEAVTHQNAYNALVQLAELLNSSKTEPLDDWLLELAENAVAALRVKTLAPGRKLYIVK